MVRINDNKQRIGDKEATFTPDTITDQVRSLAGDGLIYHNLAIFVVD